MIPSQYVLAGANGAIIYSGASRIDGAPVIVIATGFERASKNEKTGAMIQTWILRADQDPSLSLRTGNDSAICGTCPLRGIATETESDTWSAKGRRCYVNVAQAPTSIWKAYRRGSYVDCSSAPAETVSELFRNRAVRLGAYGDPAAAPVSLWKTVLRFASTHTGYSHDWRAPRSKALRDIVMASVEDAQSALIARAQGWRTFRIRAPSEALEPTEIACPASPEAGARVKCADCSLCRGASIGARSIAIVEHGGIIANRSRARA